MIFDEYVLKNNLGTIEKNVYFREITTIGCGGLIETLYSPKDLKALQQAFKFINDNDLKYFVIGNGSNVLAKDTDFLGIVINTKKLNYNLKINGDEVQISAFYPTVKLAYDLAKLELGNLAFLGGIPGLLGGAIYNNSGAYKQEVKDNLVDVTYINSAGEIVTISKEMCNFGYRKSIFHHFPSIIISAKFKLKKQKTYDLLLKRNNERKLTQPLECKSMGSIFKNNPLINAWKVIDALGMRGFHINDAAISAKHANFIINTGNASSEDIISLIELIKKRAELELGIKLESEIILV